MERTRFRAIFTTVERVVETRDSKKSLGVLRSSSANDDKIVCFYPNVFCSILFQGYSKFS